MFVWLHVARMSIWDFKCVMAASSSFATFTTTSLDRPTFTDAHVPFKGRGKVHSAENIYTRLQTKDTFRNGLHYVKTHYC